MAWVDCANLFMSERRFLLKNIMKNNTTLKTDYAKDVFFIYLFSRFIFFLKKSTNWSNWYGLNMVKKCFFQSLLAHKNSLIRSLQKTFNKTLDNCFQISSSPQIVPSHLEYRPTGKSLSSLHGQSALGLYTYAFLA